MEKIGKVMAVCISERRGTEKKIYMNAKWLKDLD